MRIIPVLAVAALSLGLGGCVSTQTLGVAAGAGVGAAIGAGAVNYYTRPPEAYPRPLPYQTRTVVVERPTYARPMYPGPTTISRTYITRQGY